MSDFDRDQGTRGAAVAAVAAVIDQLLAPWPPALFFAEVWERRTLHLQRGEAGYYADVLPLVDIAEQLFGNRNLALPSFKMYRGKEELGPQHFSDTLAHGEWAANVVNPEKLRLALRSGYSLYLNFAERVFPRLRGLLSRLERELGVKALSHLIVAPPNSQGFLPHTDPYGVLVLQLSGQKIWSSYGLRDSPLRSQGFNHHHLAQEPAAETFEVCAGDLLYLPRGTAHAAATTQAHSVHLSLVLLPPRGVDLWRILGSVAEEQAFLQEYVPASVGAGALGAAERSAYARRFKDRLIEMIEGADLFALLDRHRQVSQAGDPLPADLLEILRGGPQST